MGREEERERVFEPFLGSAARVWNEMAVKDGFWDVGMEGEMS